PGPPPGSRAGARGVGSALEAAGPRGDPPQPHRRYMGGRVPPLRPQAPPPALTPALVDQSKRWKFPARGLTRRSFTAGTWGGACRRSAPKPPHRLSLRRWSTSLGVGSSRPAGWLAAASRPGHGGSAPPHPRHAPPTAPP